MISFSFFPAVPSLFFFIATLGLLLVFDEVVSFGVSVIDADLSLVDEIFKQIMSM